VTAHVYSTPLGLYWSLEIFCDPWLETSAGRYPMA
jgi:hypothetical protein